MPEFLDKKTFSREVENMVRGSKLSYMDAALEVCERFSVDPLDVKKFLNKGIKEEIEVEAQALNFLPNDTNKLPV